jgi:RNA polymerase sigma-70 factor (ECF subfamily)
VVPPGETPAGRRRQVSAIVVSKLVSAMPSFVYEPEKRFSSWLKTVVVNAVCSFRRDRERRPGACGSGDTAVRSQLEQVAAPNDFDSLVQELGGLKDDLERVKQAVAQVKERGQPNTWEAFRLTALEGWSGEEVAAQLGISTAAVYVYKKRVGKMLREAGAKRRDQDPNH